MQDPMTPLKQGADVLETLKKYGLPASQSLLVLALGAACWKFPDWCKAHWRWLFVAAVAYEVLVLILVPLIGGCVTFLRDLWEKHFKDNALSATASWLKALPAKYSPGFAKRYRRQVALDHEVFNVKGLGLIGAHTIKLERVFVDLKIASARFERTLNDPLAKKAFENARSLWDYVRAIKDRSEDGRALAIIGPPGCGKTTLLQHAAVTLAANRQRPYRVAAYTPILLFLRDHAAAVTANPALTLGELAQSYFSRKDRYFELNPPAAWFAQQLKAGHCLVLLDGLDEVADGGQRRALSQWVDQQIKTYPRCRFVITSRPEGYKSAPLERANVVEVQNFDWEKVIRFVKGWYLAEETAGASPDLSRESIRQRADCEQSTCCWPYYLYLAVSSKTRGGKGCGVPGC